jgi:acetyl-CoA synthetase
MAEGSIEIYETEGRTFPPSAEFAAAALTGDRSLYDEAEADYEAFWARQARELLTWDEDFHTTLEWDLPFAQWFVGGTLNMTENCLDRHVAAGRGDKIAYHWEGEPGDTRTITYAELLDRVQRFANVLLGLGLEKGDRIAVYMPMIPELPITMLACARIGVVHSVIFGGFSPDAITDRCEDAEARLVVTADAGYRRGEASPLKPNVDAALSAGAPTVEHVIVVDRCGTDPEMVEGRDLWWHDLMAEASNECPAEPMDSEQLLYLLYTSGTTAKPKGIMHTTGGYLTQVAFTHRYVFDIKPDDDVFWCAADIGWVTGHSYIVYGPLTNGCTSVMYEGTPDTPREEEREGDRAAWKKDRLWDIIERYGVTQLYTAPTAIRTFMRWGEEWPAGRDLSSLRVLGTVGEPINPEAWMWYHVNIGRETCPIVDTWWQTETGGHMISPLPGVSVTKPGSACHPIPGVFADVVDDDGNVVGEGGGYLTITRPWPGMLRGIWGDPERYRQTYWSTYEGRYFAGDGARIDADGYLWLLGRVDDVMNVSGHRISTTEVESALVDHPAVAEAAVVGANDEITGQAIVGYVILIGAADATDELREEVRQHVAKKLGPTARPKAVFIVPDLPKTRSGKIMRRLLRDVADGHDLGDTTTLADPAVVAEIRDRAAEAEDDED